MPYDVQGQQASQGMTPYTEVLPHIPFTDRITILIPLGELVVEAESGTWYRGDGVTLGGVPVGLGGGGLVFVADHPTRNAIPDGARIEGMIAYTSSDQEYWRLLPAPWTDTDTDWVLLTGSAAYAAPGFTSFSISGQATLLEVGATIGAGSKTFNWGTSNSANVKPNTLAITDTTAAQVLASALPNNGSDAIAISSITNNAPASQVWTISGTNTINGSFSRTFSVAWQWRAFFGLSSNPHLSAAQILALPSSQLEAAFAGNYACGASAYKYVCFPDSLGSPSRFGDLSTGLTVAMAQSTDDPAFSSVANGYSYALVSVTNTNGVTTNYRVYRTQNQLGGALTLVVS
jgi:hypothetical protein